jgi:copper transport protein
MPPRAAWALVPAAVAGAALAVLHAVLLRTDPAADALLETPPSVVRLWFSEGIAAAPDPIVVLDPEGRRVDSAAGVNPGDGTELRASVADGGPGTYTVRWRALSEDGHVIEGDYRYSVERPSAPAAPTREGAAGRGSLAAFLLVFGRGLHLVGLTLALGALALGLLIGLAPPGTERPIARTGAAGALLLLSAAPLMLFAQTAATQGSLAGGFSHAAVAEVLHTQWANFWLARLVAAVVLAVVMLRAAGGRPPGRRLVTVALASALLLLLATSANGHALTTDPVWLSVAVDSIHLAATAAWLGGGIGLAALVWSGRRRTEGQGALTTTLTRVTPRFSALAVGCVQILIVTGLYQTWAHVSAPALLTGTDYGRTLLVKVGVFALIAAPAGINRFVMKPRLVGAMELPPAEQGALVRRFGRLVALEGALGGLVLGAAALLTTLPPAEAIAAPAPVMDHSAHVEPEAPVALPARSWSAQAGDRSVVLSLDPGLIGSNRARVSVHDADGRAVAPGSVAVRTLPPAASGLSPSLVRLAAAGDAFEALLSLGAAGEWRLELVIDGASQATFGLVVTP